MTNDAVSPVTLDEFWRLRGLIDAHGYDGAARLLRVSERQLVTAICPGVEPDVLAKLRRGLSRQAIVPLVRIQDAIRKEVEAT